MSKMEELWKAVRCSKDNIRFGQKMPASPYIEADRRDIKQSEDGILHIKINGLYRFEDIIKPLMQETAVSEELRAWLFDVWMHYLTCIAYREGFSMHEYEVRQFMSAMENGSYGSEICRLYRKLNLDERYLIADGLHKQRSTRESVMRFAGILIKLTGCGTVYKSLMNPDEVLYYAGKCQDKETEERIRLAQVLFLPMGYALRIYWQTHFGVLGQEQTMQLGAIEL